MRPLFLIACVLYAALGLWFPSALVWVFALLSLGAWMGTETGYMAGLRAYFSGMNYPLRFAIFGAALTLLGVAGQHAAYQNRLLAMSGQTKVMGPAVPLHRALDHVDLRQLRRHAGLARHPQFTFLPWALPLRRRRRRCDRVRAQAR
jgi:hypothetical protein